MLLTRWTGAAVVIAATALLACEREGASDGGLCDDGNTTDGDGCSSTCHDEGDRRPAPRR